ALVRQRRGILGDTEQVHLQVCVRSAANGAHEYVGALGRVQPAEEHHTQSASIGPCRRQRRARSRGETVARKHKLRGIDTITYEQLSRPLTQHYDPLRLGDKRPERGLLVTKEVGHAQRCPRSSSHASTPN